MVYTSNWGILCHLPPFTGTRFNQWLSVVGVKKKSETHLRKPFFGFGWIHLHLVGVHLVGAKHSPTKMTPAHCRKTKCYMRKPPLPPKIKRNSGNSGGHLSMILMFSDLLKVVEKKCNYIPQMVVSWWFTMVESVKKNHQKQNPSVFGWFFSGFM